MLEIPLIYKDESLKTQAEKLSGQWGFPLVAISTHESLIHQSKYQESKNLKPYQYALEINSSGLQLVDLINHKVNPLNIDFSGGTYHHRRLFGGGKNQLIAKAVGLNKGFIPYVLDATTGLARDAFVLASLGCTLNLVERSKPLAALLENALELANENPEIKDITNRMSLSPSDSIIYLSKTLEQISKPSDGVCEEFLETQSISQSERQSNTITQPDIIYLDPMYPEKKGSALVKKEMQILHQIIGKDEDAEQLLPVAIKLAKYRVVVKRPKTAPYLNALKPSLQLSEKKQRYDIYIKQKLPSKK